MKKWWVLILVTIVLSVAAQSCATLPMSFILESKDAIASQAADYIGGCSNVTVAPEIAIDWEGAVSFAGGVLVGCAGNGELMEFKCERKDVDGKIVTKCLPLTRWYSESSEAP